MHGFVYSTTLQFAFPSDKIPRLIYTIAHHCSFQLFATLPFIVQIKDNVFKLLKQRNCTIVLSIRSRMFVIAKDFFARKNIVDDLVELMFTCLKLSFCEKKITALSFRRTWRRINWINKSAFIKSACNCLCIISFEIDCEKSPLKFSVVKECYEFYMKKKRASLYWKMLENYSFFHHVHLAESVCICKKKRRALGKIQLMVVKIYMMK